MSVQPVDYGSVLASGRAMVPDLSAEILRQRLMAVQEQTAQTGAAEEERLLNRDRREVQRRNELGVRFREYVANPTMNGMLGLMGDFPEFHEPIRQAHDSRMGADRDTAVRRLGEVFGALRNGANDIAIRVLEETRDADRAAGEDTEDEDRIIAMIRSGDPEQVMRARGIVAYELAGRMGPERFSASLTALQDPESEQYARSFGLTPGTDEWTTAIQDYVLRGSGPTAHEFDVNLEGVRHGNRVDLEGVRHGYDIQEEDHRQGNRVALENVQERNQRTRPRAERAPPPLIERIREKVAAGTALTPGEQRIYNDYTRGQGRGNGRRGGSGGAPQYQEGARVRTPQGQVLQLRGGRWVPVS